MTFTFAMLFLLALYSAPAKAFGGVAGNAFETPHAIVFYHPGNEALAETVGNALEFAHGSVAEDLGYPANKITAYIYDSGEEMVDGLMTVLGYDRREAELIAKVGISAVTKNTFHLHPKAKTWPAKIFWHYVVHEYAHGLTEDRYGTEPALSARWLYEGLGEYEGHRSVEAKYPNFEERWSRSRYKLVFKALVFGDLFRLANLSGIDQWYANIARSWRTWDLQYAQAYVAVRYIVDEYGIERLKAVLAEISAGLPIEAAIEKVLGVSLSWLELSLVAYLLVKGMTELYVSYAVALFTIFASLVVAVPVFIRYRKR